MKAGFGATFASVVLSVAAGLAPAATLAQTPPARLTGATAQAAQRPARPAAGRGWTAGAPEGNPETMTVQQIEQYFDALVLHQARRQLELSEDQFLRFGARLQRLQTSRRQLQRRRIAAVRELTNLTAPGAASDDVLEMKLRELDTVVAEGMQEIAQAYEGIDQILSPRQRARFRVFEELMERRKLELLARARARAAAP